MANCGAISWFDGRAAYKLDPEGPVFAVPKGNLLDAARGEYSGVNLMAKEKSLDTVERVYLYSSFGCPHTSCGCFQSICFYIPEVDAFGLVYRDFVGESVVGLPFSRMAGETSGGRQVEGSCGMGLEYLRSPKFFQADGGFGRMVWMPKEIKERYRDAIPEDLYDKIATEEDVKSADELVGFLERVGHPWPKGEVKVAD
ncbi:MAG: Carbon monoxide dehydrogenase/acetyl-CoA synthase subunit alpha [Dehalococcoidia bacterium]|nr:Carbon monoxide dehydrogenase/acetyl-CoA synthase subunit alpha [Bacillota bacterium]